MVGRLITDLEESGRGQPKKALKPADKVKRRDFCEEMQLKMEENRFVERLIFHQRDSPKSYVLPLPTSIHELRDRKTHTLQAITADMLHWVWDEFDYHVDVCHVTQGAHMEGLQLTHEKLGQLPPMMVYVAPV
ncbi:hypothetical protein B7P43_G11105 [Cryptotermes secundus]|uniref:Uncharacterized protein n=1 Tax=Cryptotermes secundus TaxID=105785 RepID=A0A2J7RFD7_9NEOP|nr:hypothetical protein B7P43_G11105 [Cryptotermes secundus]